MVTITNMFAATIIIVRTPQLFNEQGVALLDAVKKTMPFKDYTLSFELVWRKWRINKDNEILFSLCNVLGLEKSVSSIIGILSVIVNFTLVLEKYRKEFISSRVLTIFNQFDHSKKYELWLFLSDMLELYTFDASCKGINAADCFNEALGTDMSEKDKLNIWLSYFHYIATQCDRSKIYNRRTALKKVKLKVEKCLFERQGSLSELHYHKVIIGYINSCKYILQR